MELISYVLTLKIFRKYRLVPISGNTTDFFSQHLQRKRASVAHARTTLPTGEEGTNDF